MRRMAQGYTVVELMMSLAVFATGVTGIIAMQRATVASNQLAKSIALADGIAEAWQSQLMADSTLWGTSVATTTWLNGVTTTNGEWQLPTWNPTLGFGPQFDAFGSPVETGGFFCAFTRLTWLYGDATQPGGKAGNGVLRSEVRVFWPRDGVNRINGDCADASQANVNAVNAAVGTYHFVTHAGAVRQPN